MSTVPRGVRTLCAAAIVVAIAAVVATVWIVGGPAEIRERKADSQRVSDLVDVRGAVRRYYETNNELPEELEGLDFYSSLASQPVDPVTGKPYGYAQMGQRQYVLAATFQHDPRSGRRPSPNSWESPFNVYRKGENEFLITVEE